MNSEVEAHRARPPVLRRVGAGLVLIVVAALAVKIVIGFVVAIFWVIVAVAAVIAVIWALKTLIW